jgi:tetratricopeptide (TPR) repeat protein
MAREQLKGEAATAQSDQFAFCVALWECLYGDRPFHGENWVSLVVAVTRGEVREPSASPEGRSVPPWLRRIVERGLRPDAGERWPSMRELAAAILAGDPHRRRRRQWMLGAGVSVAALAAAGVYAADAAAREQALAACEDSGAAIAWSDATRDRIEAAFAATDAADAAATGREIAGMLDRWVAAWTERRVDVCTAATVDQSMDPELATRSTDCLEQARSGFEAMVRTFEDADAIVVARARRSAEGLENLEQCSDDRRLRSLPALPDDATVREEVRALYEALARTLVHEHTGRYDEGLELSRAALTRALATEHLPVIAVARYRVALFLEKKGEYDEATEAWVASFHDAALGGHDQLAAEAASALAFCEGYQLARHDAGIRWAELAGVYLERLGLGDTLTEATRLDVLAVLLEQKRDYAASIATHERALEIRRANVGPDHHSIAYGLANLAGVLEVSGELQRARELLLESKRIFEASFGPSNPTTAHVLHNLGSLDLKLGEYEEAEALLLRVREIWTASLGAEHPDVGDLYNSLGDLRRAQARLDDAVAMHEKALAIHQHALAEDHPTVARTASKLAEVLVALGRWNEAQAHFDRAARD